MAASCEVLEQLLWKDPETLALREGETLGFSFVTLLELPACAPLCVSCAEMSLDSDIILLGLITSAIVVAFSASVMLFPDF